MLSGMSIKINGKESNNIVHRFDFILRESQHILLIQIDLSQKKIEEILIMIQISNFLLIILKLLNGIIIFKPINLKNLKVPPTISSIHTHPLIKFGSR